jgi:hypothetical protein
MRFECAFVGGPRDGESELLPVNIGDDLPVRFDCHEGHYLLTSRQDGDRWFPSYRYVADPVEATDETAR